MAVMSHIRTEGDILHGMKERRPLCMRWPSLGGQGTGCGGRWMCHRYLLRTV